jgi:RNA polymerase sigma-70 factor (family 1)
LTQSRTITDQELLMRVAQDDRAAFDTIYVNHWYPLYLSAYHIFHDHEACMDIVQEVFIWLWEKRKDVHVQTSLGAYLKAAIKYKTANYIRSGKIKDSFFQKIATLPVSPSLSTSDELEIKELKAIIQHAVSHLPDKCRQVFQLSRNENLSNREIALRLGISEKTVENQMTIALRKIRMEVEHYMLYMISLVVLAA